MKEVVKVGVAQIEVELLKPEANLAKHWHAVEEITKKGKVDLVVFPELSNSGYVRGMERADFAKFSTSYLRVAEKIPGSFTESLRELSRKYGIYLVTGILEAHPQIPAALYNSAVMIGPNGDMVGIYRKLHLPREEKHYFFGGTQLQVYPTELGNIGIVICADNSFPEAPRILALKGAEIICVPYCRPSRPTGDPDLYLSINSCRAFENSCFFVTCNRVGSEEGQAFEGRSCICGPDGAVLARSQTASEEFLRAELLAESLEMIRMRYARFRDRRPELYQELCRPAEGQTA